MTLNVRMVVGDPVTLSVCHVAMLSTEITVYMTVVLLYSSLYPVIRNVRTVTLSVNLPVPDL